MTSTIGDEQRRGELSNYILQSQHTYTDDLTNRNVTTLPELLKVQAERYTNATLFSFQDQTSLSAYSYTQTYETANRLANTLYRCFQNSASEAQQPVVGIWFEKSIDLHLGILATTISGAAWLPFDPDAPASRVTACLQDSKACILLCDEAHYDDAIKAVRPVFGCIVLTFDELTREARNDVGEALQMSGPKGEDTAYMIYTSGSTGTPKGIEISHSAALTFCLSERSVLGTHSNDIVWQGFSPAFDMFIEEVWVSIAGGAHLAIGNRSECQDVPALGGVAGIWAQRGVTIVNAVPTLINIMTSLDADCPVPPCVRLMNLGGEACPPSLVERLWSPSLQIFNTYGPSETTVTATYTELFPGKPVTIGKPLPMYHAMILSIPEDSQETRAPLPLRQGITGELAIGGACLGKGYVQRPALTLEKFINHPVPSINGERLYRTGDLVSLDEELNIIFLGRIDTQVKHRGFRIELGEIEHAVASNTKVQTAAVILSEKTNRLEAYVVVKKGDVVAPKERRAQLQRLPSYMQPEAWYFISADEMPRLSSGKINSKALQETSVRFAASTITEDAEKEAGAGSDIPDDGSDLSFLMRAMAKLFPQVTDITPQSDFFDHLGGHSLTAAMLVSNVRKDCAPSSVLKKIGLQAIYINRTAEAIVAGLGVSEEGESFHEKGSDSDSQLDDHWSISTQAYVLCGIAQLFALLLMFLIEAVTILAPYLIFYVLLRDVDIGSAIAATYFVFVVIPPLRTLIGILGKWLVLGKAKAGEYPLYGLYYFRWWFAERFVGMVDMINIAETPLLPAMLRCMGATIGVHCHIGVVHIGAAFDLLTIGDDAVIGKDVVLATSWIERGRLTLAPVSVGPQAFVGSNSVLEGGSSIEEGGETTAMTLLSEGVSVPAGEIWTGSPARFNKLAMDIGGMQATRASAVRANLQFMVMAFSSIFLLPIIQFAPQIPSMLLFDYVNIPEISIWVQLAIVSVPSAIIYMFLVFFELVVIRWVILGKVVECSYRTTSVYFFRKWFVDRLMAMSLVILHPVYATLYVVPFLRAIGVKIGRRAEVSTARGINYELTEIGDESFVADGVLVGDGEIRRNMVTLKKTKLNNRAFLGNVSLVPQGYELASNTLVGVLSRAPEVPLKEGQSCFGTPPVLMPARQRGTTNHADAVLYSPTFGKVLLRLFVEGMRIFVPRILITFGLAYSLQVIEFAYGYIGAGPMVPLLPFFYLCFFAFPSLLVAVLFKWILIGRYQQAEWPLWSLDVWRSEFVTSVYETLTKPVFVQMLEGTPFLGWVLMSLGVQVGSKTTLLSSDITEFDMVSLGNECVINRHAGPQTHLFEDRVMKVGRVDLERRACMKAYAICLPNSRIEEGGQLGSLSLVMKGETVPAGEVWEGAPIAPRRRRRETRSNLVNGSSSYEKCVARSREIELSSLSTGSSLEISEA